MKIEVIFEDLSNTIDTSFGEVQTASEGRAEDLDAVLTDQETLIDELKAVLRGKANGGGGSVDNGVLPIGYTPVPSIKFTGEQAVDTGIICNQDTQIKVVHTVEANNNMYVYGVANDDNTASITAYRSTSGGRWRFGSQYIALTTDVDKDIVWGVQANKTRILRCNVSSTFGKVSNFTTEGSLALGACRKADGSIEDSTRLVGRIIAFDLYNGSELVRSFVPCKNSDGVCGFWDTVSQQFFTSATDTPLEWSFI